MTEARALPIAAEHREFRVKVNGSELGREHQLLSVSVAAQANRVAWARLAYLDGAASRGDFALSGSDLFKPGATVEISAGASRDSQLVFHGLVVRHAIKVRDRSAPQLVVECRHPAGRMALARKSACFFDQADQAVMEKLLGDAGIDAQVDHTPFTHAQLVQYNVSDWDFMACRARAVGHLVLTRGKQVVVKPPALQGQSVCTLNFGATLLELDAQIDARDQSGAVQALSWDAADQTVQPADAATPALAAPGNLREADLASAAGAPTRELRHAAMPADEAQAWADATRLRARLNQASGRAKCEGVATVQPGDVVTLAGLGARFNGQVFVSGVRHEFDLVQGWKTHLQFGGVDEGGERWTEAIARPAGGVLPPVHGLQIGVVTSNEDPDGEDRVRVRMPLVAGDDGVWARVVSLDAGSGRGFFFRPEIGDEVVIGFLDDDPRRAVLLGMLHSSAKPAPLKGSDDNHQKLYQSRSGLRLQFDDEKKILSLQTPAGNRLALDDDAQAIQLTDQHGNTIKLDADGITLQSAKAFTLKAAGEAVCQSGTSFSVKAGSDLALEGSASSELSSPVTTTIKGGLVKIN